ncbi:HAD family hydrolase [Gottfriedia solisilvae]|uniref:Haloacid dehalogenase n=1 Tax=Gottfriedia solisilvae TaxID=1516104 RepID=A0A8J3AFT0_9BACI|nr:HAD family hydrolase [Gottfriedia solisilvae]GGI13105.1 haloacid dehalogenase [Gottfriedia solisilvae]
MIKVVLFDLDGTLLNRQASLIQFINDQYERFKKYFSHISIDKYRTRFIELDDRGYVWKDQVYKQLIEEFDIKGVKFEDLLEDYIHNFQHFCEPFPNLFEMLHELKQKSYRLGLITNGKEQFQMDNVKVLGLESLFPIILISEKEGLSKPNPNLFHRALAFFEVLPEEAVYIGDHPENDYNGAKNAGMKVIWKKDTYWEDFFAEFMIDDLLEIPTIIEQF